MKEREGEEGEEEEEGEKREEGERVKTIMYKFREIHIRGLHLPLFIQTAQLKVPLSSRAEELKTNKAGALEWMIHTSKWTHLGFNSIYSLLSQSQKEPVKTLLAHRHFKLLKRSLALVVCERNEERVQNHSNIN